MIDNFKLFLGGLKSQLEDIWNRSKMVLLAIVALVVALEFQKIKDALILYSGKKEIEKDKDEEKVLSKKENDEKTEADSFVKAAQELQLKEQPVSDDWNVKK